MVKAELQTEIVRLPLADLPDDGPRLVVVEIAAGAAVATRYRRAWDTARPLPAGQPLVALVRSTPLSTPDRIHVIDASSDGQRFTINLDIRYYSGDLAANVVTIALVQVMLGSLVPGEYQAIANEATTDLFDLNSPDNTRPATAVAHALGFRVQ